MMKYPILLLLLCISQTAYGLTHAGVKEICDASPVACEQHPILQAYVGGALDLVATLDEQTDYLAPVYCKHPSELFDVPAMIQHILNAESRQPDDNAMLSVIDYLVTFGGCQSCLLHRPRPHRQMQSARSRSSNLPLKTPACGR